MKMVLKIGKYRAPPFLVGGKGENYVLQVPHISSDYPFDKPAKLEVLDSFPFIAFLSAEDVRGTSDGSPSYMKYIFYSYSLSENKKIMTSYLTYTFTGPIIVKAWDEKKKSLLENIDMNHIDIAPDRIPNKLIPEHLRRIKGKDLQSKGLVEMFDETLTDMYNCVPVSYCLWTGKK